MDRRALLLGTTALAAGTLASCGTNNIDVIATVAQLIQKIQAGVAQACAAVGKWVPTVDTVLTVLASLLGATVVQANLAAAVAVIQQAIDAIAAQCPSTTPAAGPRSATIGGKTVPIIFY